MALNLSRTVTSQVRVQGGHRTDAPPHSPPTPLLSLALSLALALGLALFGWYRSLSPHGQVRVKVLNFLKVFPLRSVAAPNLPRAVTSQVRLRSGHRPDGPAPPSRGLRPTPANTVCLPYD